MRAAWKSGDTLAKLEAHDLSRASSWYLIDKVDSHRDFVGRKMFTAMLKNDC
jgi:hypothetical protein